METLMSRWKFAKNTINWGLHVLKDDSGDTWTFDLGHHQVFSKQNQKNIILLSKFTFFFYILGMQNDWKSVL